MSISGYMIEVQVPIHGSVLSMAAVAGSLHDTRGTEAECGANNYKFASMLIFRFIFCGNLVLKYCKLIDPIPVIIKVCHCFKKRYISKCKSVGVY